MASEFSCTRLWNYGEKYQFCCRKPIVFEIYCVYYFTFTCLFEILYRIVVCDFWKFNYACTLIIQRFANRKTRSLTKEVDCALKNLNESRMRSLVQRVAESRTSPEELSRMVQALYWSLQNGGRISCIPTDEPSWVDSNYENMNDQRSWTAVKDFFWEQTERTMRFKEEG